MFRNDPTSPPITSSQVLGLFLYIVAVCISVWATGESLVRNFDIGRVPAYILGTVISLIAAAMLNLIREGIFDKKGIQIAGSFLVFIIVWGLSLLTNTHSFFIRSSLNDIRKEELGKVISALDLIGDKTEEALDRSKELFVQDINGRVNSLKRQILDPNNPGLGPRAQDIILELETLLEQPITPIEPDGSASTFRGNKELADGYANYIQFDLLEPKIAVFDREKARVINSLTNDDTDTLREQLKQLQINDLDLTNKEARNFLARAFTEYNRQFKYISDKFSSPILGKLATYSFENLPERPKSLELRKISSLPRFIRETGGYNQPNVIWAFLLALGVDLGAFIIFYFMVLPKKKTW